MRSVNLKRKLKYTEKAGAVAGWMPHGDQYVGLYYSEHHNRDIQLYNLEI